MYVCVWNVVVVYAPNSSRFGSPQRADHPARQQMRCALEREHCLPHSACVCIVPCGAAQAWCFGPLSQAQADTTLKANSVATPPRSLTLACDGDSSAGTSMALVSPPG